MKIAAAFLFLSFLLCALDLLNATTNLPVVDIAGKKLITGSGYYILPVIRGRGGGLTLAATRNKTCPLDVVQELHEIDNGIPATFSPVNVKKGVIRESTDMNVKFLGATICVQSSVWKLDKYDESRNKYFVTSGGVEGSPGLNTTANWFKIQKHLANYKLVFCPTVCKFCKVICKDVGYFIDNGRRILALTDDEPLRIMFKKS